MVTVGKIVILVVGGTVDDGRVVVGLVTAVVEGTVVPVVLGVVVGADDDVVADVVVEETTVVEEATVVELAALVGGGVRTVVGAAARVASVV